MLFVSCPGTSVGIGEGEGEGRGVDLVHLGMYLRYAWYDEEIYQNYRLNE